MTERTNYQWVNDLQQNGSTRLQAIYDLREFIEHGLYAYLGTRRYELVVHSDAELRQIVQKFAGESLLQVLDNLPFFRGTSQFTTWASKFAARIATFGLRSSRPIRAQSELPNPLVDHMSIEMSEPLGVQRSEN